MDRTYSRLHAKKRIRRLHTIPMHVQFCSGVCPLQYCRLHSMTREGSVLASMSRDVTKVYKLYMYI